MKLSESKANNPFKGRFDFGPFTQMNHMKETVVHFGMVCAWHFVFVRLWCGFVAHTDTHTHQSGLLAKVNFISGYFVGFAVALPHNENIQLQVIFGLESIEARH